MGGFGGGGDRGRVRSGGGEWTDWSPITETEVHQLANRHGRGSGGGGGGCSGGGIFLLCGD